MSLHKACALCAQPAAAAVNLGPLLGPVREERGGGVDELYVHRLCALWSSEARACRVAAADAGWRTAAAAAWGQVKEVGRRSVAVHSRPAALPTQAVLRPLPVHLSIATGVGD